MFKFFSKTPFEKSIFGQLKFFFGDVMKTKVEEEHQIHLTKFKLKILKCSFFPRVDFLNDKKNENLFFR